MSDCSSDPFVGEIRWFAFGEPPPGWLPCDGQVLTRMQYAKLFTVLGTLYGGDGHETFSLPNLQGRVALHIGNDVALGDAGGEETHELTVAEMPNHTHLLSANLNATTGTAANHFWSSATGAYSTAEPDATLAPHALAAVGDGQPHPNLQPYLTLNLCIAASGVLPSSLSGLSDTSRSDLIGEVRLFAGTVPPNGWAACDGQLLSIQEHTHLFAILGTTFGGDGQTSFALPDLRGRVPLGEGRGAGLTARALGESGGDANVMLTQSELPMHSHAARCAVGTAQHGPEGATWSGTRWENAYAPSTDDTLMSPRSVEFVGGYAAHNNMQPYLGLSYIIALEGTFPSR